MNKNLQNITIQDFLAVIVSIGVFALVLCKYQVPDQIWSGWMVILTFFFNQNKPLQTTPSNEPTIVSTTSLKTGA